MLQRISMDQGVATWLSTSQNPSTQDDMLMLYSKVINVGADSGQKLLWMWGLTVGEFPCGFGLVFRVEFGQSTPRDLEILHFNLFTSHLVGSRRIWFRKWKYLLMVLEKISWLWNAGRRCARCVEAHTREQKFAVVAKSSCIWKLAGSGHQSCSFMIH